MHVCWCRTAVLVLSLRWLVPSAVAAEELARAPEADEFFEKSVRPLLAARCLECHGATEQSAGLRLDSRAAILAGGDTGPAIVPGKPEKSLLITAVHYGDDSPQMPPKGKLSEEQIAALTTWVKLGAPWPETKEKIRSTPADRALKITPEDRSFWAFQPIANPPVPVVKDQSWPRREIDSFILARLEAAGLSPSPPADKRTLIRRLTFDLLGLPPTPAEVEAFLTDESPDAFAKVVDRLLESPHYGERWARHWLDIARYGEDQAHTFEARKYPQGFRYRDWLIHAFNRDLPYDQLIKEQLAADLLPGDNKLERLPALGFFALGPVYYGDRKMLDQFDDRIDTLTRGLLGLTVACARCHDHKYDPISTEDYYGLAGVIASTEYVDLPLVSQEEIEAADKTLTDEERKKKVKVKKYPHIHTLKDAETPTNLRVHIRGSADNLGDEVPRSYLSILSGDSIPQFTEGSGRRELAELIASPQNPLTARVMVNRIWKHHFGEGLVRTPSNFGALGERPTHPDLLDYLATRFITSGCSIKALHREIMLSAAYQQSSKLNSRHYEIDPQNRLLWRMNRRRLEVEAWRDAMLAVAGTLDAAIGGPSGDLADAGYRRRTLYGMVSRHQLNDLLRLFDFPDPNITSDSRPVTTVPLQQLFVLNSDFLLANAQALATRLAAECEGDDAERIRYAFALLYARQPSARELQLGLDYLAGRNQTAAEPPSEANGDTLSRWEQYAQVLLSTNEFLYVD